MGGCCGKGAAPKDPDKTPYGPAKKTSGDVDTTTKAKSKAVAKPVAAVAAAGGDVTATGKTEVPAAKSDDDAKKDGGGDADSFVVIEVKQY